MAKVFTGTEADETVTGTAGNDYLYGYLGNDKLTGLGGQDILRGSFGTDDLDGGEGADGLSGNDDDDKVFGGNGFDIIRGDDGQDEIDAGGGNDVVSGGPDADTLTGGPGSDIFVYPSTKDSRPSAPDFVTDFDPTVDRFDFSSIDASEGRDGGQRFTFLGTTTSTASAEPMTSTPNVADTFAGRMYQALLGLGQEPPAPNPNPQPSSPFTAEGQVRAYIEGGQTYIEANTKGLSDPEMVIRLQGEHQLTAANFLFEGDNNRDRPVPTVRIGDGGFEHEDDGTLTPNQPPTDDTFNGYGGEDYLYGAWGNDTLLGGGDIDIVRGGADDDLLDGGEGYDVLDGSTGNDTLLGGAGNFADLLRGQQDNDLLDGGGGDDFLDGGEGRDLFRFTGAFGNDTVADFRVGQDKLQIDVDGVTGLGDLGLSGNTVTVGNAGTITLNIPATSLGAGDIEFI